MRLGGFGLTPLEIILRGGFSEAKQLLHRLHLYRWGNCTCHKMPGPATASQVSKHRAA